MPGMLRIPVMIVLLAGGCATHGQQPAATTPDIVVTGQQAESAPIPAAPPSTPRQEETASAVEPLPEPAPAPSVISEQPAAPDAAPAPAEKPPAVIPKPVVTAPAKTAAPPAQIQPQKKTGAAKPPPAPQAPPPMALAVLEQRLKDTGAIGVFTKLALKNQVDDLVSRIKAHHEGNGSATLAQLRQSYDQLLARVHGLLKDGDPPLAGAIMASREAIWTVLTDPVKFAKL